MILNQISRWKKVSLNEIIRTVINENKSTFIVNSIYPKLVAEENVIVKSDKKNG